jgi:hypothetical protein
MKQQLEADSIQLEFDGRKILPTSIFPVNAVRSQGSWEGTALVSPA